MTEICIVSVFKIKVLYASVLMSLIKHLYCVEYQVCYYSQNGNIPWIVINLDIEHSSMCLDQVSND